VWTLAVVERPQAQLGTIRITHDIKKHDDQDDFAKGSATRNDTTETSSLRETFRLLYRTGGIFGFFRGFAGHIMISLAAMLITVAGTIPLWLSGIVKASGEGADFGAELGAAMANLPHTTELIHNTIMSVVSSLLLVSWKAAFVHIVITVPTLRIWYRRLPPYWTTLVATWRPQMISVLASTIAGEVPCVLHRALSLRERKLAGNGEYLTSYNFWLVLIWLFSRAFAVAVVTPSDIALLRIQASLLPEGEETIIPFDRSFGTGEEAVSMHPGILAKPTSPLSLRAAYSTFTRNDIRRMGILLVKLVAIEAGLCALFWPVLGNDAFGVHYKPLTVFR
jgi:hypothetical protein